MAARSHHLRGKKKTSVLTFCTFWRHLLAQRHPAMERVISYSFSVSRAARLKDKSLEDSANLPDPDIIAQEIVEDLQAALAQFAEIASDLKRGASESKPKQV